MIYMLEDDANIRNFVLYALNNSGLAAKGFERPSAFWAALKEETPSVLLLDIMLPEEDGMQVLAKLRSCLFYTSFLGSVGTVVAQGGKNALCKALVLVYLVHYH